MRNWYLAGVCGLMVATMSGIAEAGVDGQSFSVSVSSTVSGNFDGLLSFDSTNFLFVAESLEGGIGTYTQVGAALTFLSAEGDNGAGYMGEFVAVAFDPKQLPGLLGAIARNQEIPSQIYGRGEGNVGDTFTFSGEEVLVTTTPAQ